MKAIFKRDFHWSRPKGIGFFAQAKEEPQSFPHDFIEAAVEGGAAVKVGPKKKAEE